MMDSERIKQLIEAGLPDCHAEVDGDGHHFQAIIVSPVFEGKLILQQHRLVKDVLKQHFDSGELHALSMKTLTPEQSRAGQS
ncbi:acid stress-induced BolA-like protein IbaG/YrbA [Natronocella acetinitrilica]|uniref:Acid stress-induced BolA-like protein IbaG/YrbA n=1 Tax=Natronocella acetinitrilica TaxID=414046 RepID=A0AAE3KAV5_9GAMM|nr:BolA/IbaG family iron-sulfur metabolism protein [Natronocella acetinitrilica]MCP1673881.1 acid stress-induced BolA-like protein IbaG/YrbA [Natronocella acetinitrilica]